MKVQKKSKGPSGKPAKKVKPIKMKKVKPTKEKNAKPSKTKKAAKKKSGKGATAPKSNPSWTKIKLAGNLISDDGGAGLEGLLGLEVLEDYGGVLSVTKEKPKKFKRERPTISNNKDENFSDDDEADGKKGKKKKKKNKKAENTVTEDDGDDEVDVEQAETNKTAGQFVLLKQQSEGDDGNAEQATNQKPVGKGKKVPKNKRAVEVIDESKRLEIDDLIGWNGLGVPEPVLRALAEKGFRSPTEIQALTLPSAIMGRKDILGAAETGSGKTLAFGIPIINGILQLKSSNDQRPFRKPLKSKNSDPAPVPKPVANEPQRNKRKHDERDNWTPPPEEINNFPDFGRDNAVDDDDDSPKTKAAKSRPLYALILTPTRELAVQVKDHIISAAKYTGIKVAAIFGGLAAVKQERVLAQCPEIIVATPGRLWELFTEGNAHLQKLPSINFLVIDETDRMVEKGHFEELSHILEKLNADPIKAGQRQNFVFSATLTTVHELPRYIQTKNAGRKKKLQTQTVEQKLELLIQHLGISQPKIVDITPKQATGGTAKQLTECRITCPLEQKDLYLYYFLKRHPGRSIVFCNSIECVRRLIKLFTILDCEPWGLHAKMAQRQRLKNLERFTASATGLLIATDVAARGLDIPHVEHVIHYQVPRTSENYIHRSGRTARANSEGLAILIMAPGEINDYVKLCRNLQRSEDLPLFPVSDRYLSSVRERVALARQVDILELKVRRTQSDIGWLRKSAKEMDILVDDMSDFSEGDMYDSDDGNGAVERTKERRTLKQRRDQLNRLLGQPIFPKGFSYKYPTSTTSLTPEAIQASNAAAQQSNGIEEKLASTLSTKKSRNVDEGNAVAVMKNAIEDYKLAKKQRNKKNKH